jgi:hypothetical protein
MFDFATNQEVETLDVVPENFRVFYTEGETGFKLNSEEPAISVAVASITGLAKSLNAARNDAKNNKVDLSPLADFGTNPAEIAESVTTRMEELNKQIKDGGKAKIDVEKIKAELSSAHSADIEKRQAREQALTNQLYGMLVTSEATTAITANKGIPELLMPFVKDQVQVVEQDGKMTAYVVDAEGSQRYSGTTGAPMTINELIMEMKSNKQFGRVFESDTPSGPGSPPRQQSQHIKPADGELSATQKIANGLKRGLATRPGRD